MNKVFLVGVLIAFAVFLLGLVLYLALSYKVEPSSLGGLLANDNLGIGSLAPDFTLQDIEGNQVILSSFRGEKPVLLVFWATWCKFCAEELPGLKEFAENHKEDIQVIVIPSGEVKRTIKEYIAEKNINFLMLLDETKEIWNDYGVRGTPAHFLINKEGKIAVKKPGFSNLDNLEKMLLMVR